MGSVPCYVFEGSNNNSKAATTNTSSSSSSSSLPWKEMFRSASFRVPRSDPFSMDHQSLKKQEQATPNKSSNASQADHQSQIRNVSRSFSMGHNHECTFNIEDNSSTTLPWQTMFQTASIRNPDLTLQNQQSLTQDNVLINAPKSTETKEKMCHLGITFPSDAQMWLAFYVTLTQATLVVAIFILYAFFKLLGDYIRPVIWAALCSIPLRGIQEILIEFWSEPLKAGLIDTALAVPVAILKASSGTIIDARDVLSCVFYGEKLEDAVRPEKNGFLRLVRRLVSFGLFVFAYEQIGKFGAFTLIGLGFMFSSNLSSSTISAVSKLRSDSFRLRNNTCSSSENNRNPVLYKMDKFVSQWILSRLKTILAVGLIVGLITGSLAGVIFFSYQIGSEGKDAVISIKSHIEDSKYADKLGIKRWIYENNAMELMDWYTNECYGTLLQQIDTFASKYNLSELVEVIKQFVITPYTDFPKNSSSIVLGTPLETKYTLKLGNIMEKPVLDKAKCFATQGMDLSFRILASSKFILDGSAHFLLYIGQSMVSGAAGLVQFSIQSTVFIWVLYYLLTSKSGEVTEQVMKVIPVSKTTKNRCVETLNNAISGVLLATTEIAFFQGCFTWLLCRLFCIHFVYMSTMLAFINPLLPIFPSWLPAFPGAVELLLDGRYVLAIGFCITHIVVTDIGASEIAEYVPGYSTYLTGVSIIGGMTLFPSAIEVTLSYLLAI